MSSRPATPGNLPADPTAFIGRRHLLDEVTPALASARLVTLVGVGGVGKTRAAVQLGRTRERTAPGGVWLIDLAAIDGPELVARAVAGALGVHDHSERPMLDTVVAHLRDREPLLLILDNCEHVAPAVADLVDALIRRTDVVRVLTTSRQRLGVAGERILHVHPMSVPTVREVSAARSLDALTHYDAVRLFLERAADACAELSDQDTHAVGQLVRSLEGVPLAIELAAARTATLSIPTILDRLDDPLRVLASADRVPHPHHHQSLAATLDWSYHLCSPAEQRLWARVAVFTSNTDLDAIEYVCADDQHLPAAEIMNVVEGLTRQSLLTPHRSSTGVRYRMLETVRAYGMTRLIKHGEEAQLRARHRDYYRTLTEHAARDHQSPRELHWMTRLRQELPNIRTALTSAVASGDTDTGLAIVVNINRSRGWFFAGTLSEARYWSRTLLANRPDTPFRLPVLAGGAWIATCQGDKRSALSIIADCLRIVRDQPVSTDISGASADFIKGAYQMVSRSNVASATANLARARDLFLRAGHADDAYMARLCLAIATAVGPDPDAAFVAAADCLADATASHATWSVSWAQWAYGLAHLRHGDPRHAATLFATALHAQRDTADHWGPPWSIAALGWHAAATSHHEKAAFLLGAAHRQRQLVGVDIDGITLLATLDAQAEATSRAALGQIAYTNTHARGAALNRHDAIAAALTNHTEPLPNNHTRTNHAPDHLTRREHDIARLLSQDASMTNKEMANRLYISVRTVDSHIGHILRKLGLTSRSQIAVWATTHGPLLR